MNSAPAPAPAPNSSPNTPRPSGRNFDRRPPRPGSASRRIQRILRRPSANPIRQERSVDYFPTAPDPSTARIVPLGGLEEVGRNMVAMDVNGDIFVFDVGFAFKEEDDVPGADYTLPNTAFLEKNKDRVRGVIITHGHLDHIGGIPFLMARFGNPNHLYPIADETDDFEAPRRIPGCAETRNRDG